MAIDRKSALCDQTALTGIDFIQVVDPQVQTVLRVYFVVEPSDLDVPMVDGTLLAPPPAGSDEGAMLVETALGVAIESRETGRLVAVEALGWRLVRTAAGIRLALEIAVKEQGGFAIHRLTIADPRVDPFFNGRDFSFKQGCPSLFDCAEQCDPEPIESVDFPVDYLARDFHSFRRALLDFAAERYPMWSEAIEADEAVMLIEILAALGDEMSYQQDRIANELTLETARQRRSRANLARLVDYTPDPGAAAETELAIFVRAGAGGASPDIGARAWALPEGREPVPFSVRPPANEGDLPLWHHEAWNRIPLHQPDSDVACLPEGSTEAFLVTGAPTAAQLPPGTTLSPTEFWTGRRAMLRSRPSDPAEPVRAFAITITDAAHVTDELVLTAGAPTALTRIRWAEPTPWALPLAETDALLNLVSVVAGEELVERFRVGSDAAAAARFPGLTPIQLRDVLALPRTIERQGAFDAARGSRGRILRYGLRGSETRGLGWEGRRDPLGIGTVSARRPMLELREVTPPAFAPTASAWLFERDMLAAGLDNPAFTLDEGMWRTVVTHQTPFEDVPFDDYAGNDGWTLRFGDGEFGRPPEEGTVLEVRYFSAPGTAANLAPDSITHLAPPPGAAGGALFGYAAAATNPLPITSGGDEESAAEILINAPEAWRALPLRAVRPEDYRDIVGRLDWVQRANAVTAWTGSWSTDFVAADPVGGVAYDGEQRGQLEAVVDCVRLAARDARVADPDYVDIDLRVEVCVDAASYPGEVVPQIIRALSPPGLFSPDNFTFGQPLRRSSIEAAIHATPGVKGVEEIRVRVRRRGDWEVFDMAEVAVGPSQIIRLQNDPLFPSRGSLRVAGHGGAA